MNLSLPELVAKWRKQGEKLSVRHRCGVYFTCADELEAALAASGDVPTLQEQPGFNAWWAREFGTLSDCKTFARAAWDARSGTEPTRETSLNGFPARWRKIAEDMGSPYCRAADELEAALAALPTAPCKTAVLSDAVCLRGTIGCYVKHDNQ